MRDEVVRAPQRRNADGLFALELSLRPQSEFSVFWGDRDPEAVEGIGERDLAGQA